MTFLCTCIILDTSKKKTTLAIQLHTDNGWLAETLIKTIYDRKKNIINLSLYKNNNKKICFQENLKMTGSCDFFYYLLE